MIILYLYIYELNQSENCVLSELTLVIQGPGMALFYYAKAVLLCIQGNSLLSAFLMKILFTCVERLLKKKNFIHLEKSEGVCLDVCVFLITAKRFRPTAAGQ